MKLFEKEISEISRSLSRGSEKQKALALTLRDALAEKGGINVTTLQKAMKKMSSGAVVSKKGDADGFFGPLTLKSLQDIAGISATPSVSETMRPTVSETPDNLKKSPQKPTVSPVLTSPATSEKSKDTYHEDQKNLDKLYSAWKLAVKAADSLSDAAERKANAELIDVSLKALADAMADFHAKYVAGKSDAYALQNAEYLRYMNNSIALYLRGESKIGNKHYRDPIAAEAMLKNTLGTKIKAPMLPTQDQFMASLDGNTQTLIKNMLDAKMKQGKTFEEALGETLGNPTIKGAWDRVIENGFAKYEKDMAAAIEKVDRTILTSQEKSSLDQLRDMYGTAAWYNLKDQNKQKLKMVGIQLAAVALGVGGAALTATGLGAEAGVPMVIAASALVGGAITTGTTMYAEGKIYSGKELLQEGSINVGTFLVGGMLFKVVRLESVIAKI